VTPTRVPRCCSSGSTVRREQSHAAFGPRVRHAGVAEYADVSQPMRERMLIDGWEQSRRHRTMVVRVGVRRQLRGEVVRTATETGPDAVAVVRTGRHQR
jgi:hypothetical protein